MNSSSSLPSSSLSFPSQRLPQHHSSSGCNLTDKLLFFNSLKSFLMKQNTHVKKKTSEVKIEFIQLSIKKKSLLPRFCNLKNKSSYASLLLQPHPASWRRMKENCTHAGTQDAGRSITAASPAAVLRLRTAGNAPAGWPPPGETGGRQDGVASGWNVWHHSDSFDTAGFSRTTQVS